MPRPERHLIGATASAVRGLLLALEEGPYLAGLPEEARCTALLVLAEALNNVVEHAYAGGPGWIGVFPIVGQGGKGWRIMDGGRPAPDFSARPVGMPDGPAEGGFGWPLIRVLTDEVRQSRRRGWNVLTLQLRGGPESGPDTGPDTARKDGPSTRWRNRHEGCPQEDCTTG